MNAAHRKPKLPDGICIYAVSDIHGCADELAKVFAAIDHHLSRAGLTDPSTCSWATISIADGLE